MPPTELASTTPTRSASSLAKSSPASFAACTAAAMPYWIDRSKRRASFGSPYLLKSKSAISAAISLGRPAVSKRVTRRAPL